MKVLFVPWGMATHYFHLVPLAWALRAAGHEVRVAGQPAIAGAVQGSGVINWLIGGSDDTTAKTAELAKQVQTAHQNFDRRESDVMKAAEQLPTARASAQQARQAIFAGEAVALADDLVRVATEWRPDLIVADPVALAAPLAARAVGAPLVHHVWGPSIPHQIKLPGCGCPTDQWNDDLRALYERFGVEPRTEYAVGTVDTCPADLQVPGVPDRIPMRYVPYNGPGSVPAWLSQSAERPRVCVTWGTTTTAVGGPEHFAVPRILAGLAGHDVEVVLAIRAADRELLGEAPEGVRVVEGLPLHLLLPTCDAIIHQGGYGSLLTASCLGLPQVIVPTMPHLALSARQVTNAGAGVTVSVDSALEEQIKSAASIVLGDAAVRASARRLQEENLAAPTPAETVGTLEKLV